MTPSLSRLAFGERASHDRAHVSTRSADSRNSGSAAGLSLGGLGGRGSFCGRSTSSPPFVQARADVPTDTQTTFDMEDDFEVGSEPSAPQLPVRTLAAAAGAPGSRASSDTVR